jgi:hypothetical protein
MTEIKEAIGIRKDIIQRAGCSEPRSRSATQTVGDLRIRANHSCAIDSAAQSWRARERNPRTNCRRRVSIAVQSSLLWKTVV